MAVLSGHLDDAFEDLAVEFEHHVDCFWDHAVVALEALAAEFEALDGTQVQRADAAWAACEHVKYGEAAKIYILSHLGRHG